MAVELFDAIEPDRIRNFGNVAHAIFGGRMEYAFDNAAGFTWEFAIRVAAKPYAVAPIFGQSRDTTSASPAFLATVKCVPALAEVESYGSWTACTFGGSGTSTLTAAASATRRKLVLADLAEVAGVDPTDGGSGWWIVVRCWVNGGTNLRLLGNTAGTDSFANWASRSGRRQVRIQRRVGGGDSTTSSGQSWSAVNYCPIVGVKYATVGPVLTVIGCGDSITEGRGTHLGDSHLLQACESLTAAGPVPVEYANIGWAGCTSASYRTLLSDAFSDGVRGDIVAMPAGTPNDISTTISAAQIDTFNTRLAVMAAKCRDNDAEPLIWTMLPSNNSVKAYGATDSLRVAHNAAVFGARANGLVCVDTATVINGTTTGGQIEMAAALEDDGVHPNDAGNAAMAPVIAAGIERIARGLLKAV